MTDIDYVQSKPSEIDEALECGKASFIVHIPESFFENGLFMPGPHPWSLKVISFYLIIAILLIGGGYLLYKKYKS